MRVGRRITCLEENRNVEVPYDKPDQKTYIKWWATDVSLTPIGFWLWASRIEPIISKRVEHA